MYQIGELIRFDAVRTPKSVVSCNSELTHVKEKHSGLILSSRIVLAILCLVDFEKREILFFPKTSFFSFLLIRE